ncbi:hypothetical protein [Bartonella gliris]|uniref:hypothetical protein n=1 Tax=Bartonella gliris TaxID=3004109 RepID=UPI0038730C2D
MKKSQPSPSPRPSIEELTQRYEHTAPWASTTTSPNTKAAQKSERLPPIPEEQEKNCLFQMKKFWAWFKTIRQFKDMAHKSNIGAQLFLETIGAQLFLETQMFCRKQCRIFSKISLLESRFHGTCSESYVFSSACWSQYLWL